MSELKFKKTEDGVWDISNRGTIELTRQGVFFFWANKPDVKWSAEELMQITAFIDSLRATK
jgi:hypothetical protein